MHKVSELSKQVRAVIIKRDDGKCKSCGTTEYLTVDHIVPKSEGGTNEFNNLETLCRVCHERKDHPTNRWQNGTHSKDRLKQILAYCEGMKKEASKNKSKSDFMIRKYEQEKGYYQSKISQLDKRINEIRIKLRAYDLSTERVYVEMPK